MNSSDQSSVVLAPSGLSQERSSALKTYPGNTGGSCISRSVTLVIPAMSLPDWVPFTACGD